MLINIFIPYLPQWPRLLLMLDQWRVIDEVGVDKTEGLLSLNESLVFYFGCCLLVSGLGFYLYSGKGEKYPYMPSLVLFGDFQRFSCL